MIDISLLQTDKKLIKKTKNNLTPPEVTLDTINSIMTSHVDVPGTVALDCNTLQDLIDSINLSMYHSLHSDGNNRLLNQNI